MQPIIVPPDLRKGDTIGITCPSGHLPIERTIFAKQTLESWGFNVVMGSTVGSGHFYFSETDERRLYDLQSMLDNENIHAILMGRGGYGLSRIIDKLDFTKFKARPKWICGFSDITVLHSHIQSQFGIATLHSPMCAAFKAENDSSAPILSLLNSWKGAPSEYNFPANEHNRAGKGEGILAGGNLAILAHLSGSVSQINTDGKILFIEDIGEYLYNIDRLLLNLKRAGTLSNLQGLVCGGFSDMKDTERPFGQDIFEIIKDKVAEYDYPVCFDFPAGHIEENFTLQLGKLHYLNVGAKNVSLYASV
ncbi:LD-carboxypeptidase [Taibaiella lutea]|uniref:LD-carboxypeptidase n=1 Tax=Taibaiella lutea TaxID=2608001 RepID=A0A5M6CPC0_9BACT|nr:LD-carboxypeptidase [Taibaiella lutea]KAA5536984.1 LD-carboxypeptidase [Taibaiella lutea]